jgi:ADP-ribose pyrophosphatase YjhB (NUDIX family)
VTPAFARRRRVQKKGRPRPRKGDAGDRGRTSAVQLVRVEKHPHKRSHCIRPLHRSPRVECDALAEKDLVDCGKLAIVWSLPGSHVRPVELLDQLAFGGE